MQVKFHVLGRLISGEEFQLFIQRVVMLTIFGGAAYFVCYVVTSIEGKPSAELAGWQEAARAIMAFLAGKVALAGTIFGAVGGMIKSAFVGLAAAGTSDGGQFLALISFTLVMAGLLLAFRIFVVLFNILVDLLMAPYTIAMNIGDGMERALLRAFRVEQLRALNGGQTYQPGTLIGRDPAALPPPQPQALPGHPIQPRADWRGKIETAGSIVGLIVVTGLIAMWLVGPEPGKRTATASAPVPAARPAPAIIREGTAPSQPVEQPAPAGGGRERMALALPPHLTEPSGLVPTNDIPYDHPLSRQQRLPMIVGPTNVAFRITAAADIAAYVGKGMSGAVVVYWQSRRRVQAVYLESNGASDQRLELSGSWDKGHTLARIPSTMRSSLRSGQYSVVSETEDGRRQLIWKITEADIRELERSPLRS